MAGTQTVACATCELHAEAVFRVEGMDCNEEVVILERRLKPLDGLEAVSADLDRPAAARQVRRGPADARRRSSMPSGQTGMRMWLEHEEPAVGGADIAWRWRLMVGCCGRDRRRAGGVRGRPAWRWPPSASRRRRSRAASSRPGAPSPPSGRARLDINTLMVVAVVGALLLGEWLEAASVVFLFAVAQWLEVRTLERARQAIRALIDLSPREAIVRQRRRRTPGRRWTTSVSATRSSCGRATRCRSTASSCPGTATSTRRR